jgi:hypothetical protein
VRVPNPDCTALVASVGVAITFYFTAERNDGLQLRALLGGESDDGLHVVMVAAVGLDGGGFVRVYRSHNRFSCLVGGQKH